MVILGLVNPELNLRKISGIGLALLFVEADLEAESKEKGAMVGWLLISGNSYPSFLKRYGVGIPKREGWQG
jgi:hypothetical protein